MAEDTWKKRMDAGPDAGLEPLEPLDVRQIGDFDEMLAAMAKTSFSGRRLGEAAEVLEAMVRDPDCKVVMTLSGAMTVAKMNLVIAEMIELGWVHAVVSTGALMTHGLVELSGMKHYKARGDLDDTKLFEKGYNRVYDTYELEANLNALGQALDEAVFPKVCNAPYASHDLLREMGAWLAKTGRRGVVSAAYRHGVPIYIPAFTDSEMALDVASWTIKQRVQAGESLDHVLATMETPFDPFRDLTDYTTFVRGADRLGIFTIGGGVPRNWAQQASPFLDFLNVDLELEEPLNRFRYGVRICPEPVHWGGLSGCTYSEGVSWGKFIPPSEGGRYAEVYADATTVWPLLVAGVAQRLSKKSSSSGNS